ncbi:hypothetical protein HRE53_05955 [Acaryochloris sp. 'Moss Beach']|uniref:CU044_2847 family protein n=1 Tax=Acaryochloris sp. 'Moss Beach' TaxID=2740837 RepID=UPI001F1D8293|nr:CU044_2847 family protein [Acaryochloris sp. 'Moss Beach']UJB70619.1 hypothetical protein HRE53_05955 [Acaryochloris sp. 'Moss Beach']
MASERTEVIKASLGNGSIVQIQISATGGRQDVAGGKIPDLKDVGRAIEGIVDAVATPINKAMPSKATVKFGIDIAVEPGQLTALLVKGGGNATLEVTLEWEQKRTP